MKKTFVDLIFEDIDLYSAVSFEKSDKEMIDEFEAISLNIKIYLCRKKVNSFIMSYNLVNRIKLAN